MIALLFALFAIFLATNMPVAFAMGVASLGGLLSFEQVPLNAMVTRMFKRRATWENQFITHPDFGLFRLLTKQFASPDKKLTIYSKEPVGNSSGVDFSLNLWIIYIVILGIGGIMESIKRSPPEGLFIVLTMLLCTVGLVFYILIMAALARTAFRLYRRSADPWSRGLALGFMGAQSSVAFQAMFGSYLEVRTLAIYLWFVAAIVVVLAKREELV